MKKLSIVIPIYNEKETLPEIIEKVEKANTLGLEKEIVLVDDCSTDGTREILKNLENKYKVLYHAKNQGKGAALRTGFQKADGDIILIQDADLEYNPKEYPKLLKPILANEADIVYGSRNIKRNPSSYSRYYWGGIFINWLHNIFYGCHLTDVLTCYKSFKAPALKGLKLESNGFEFESEVTIKALKKKYEILETPIDYNPRTIEQGKKIRTGDGLIIIWQILKNKFVL